MELGEVVGVGNTAIIYAYGEDKVIKLFHEGYGFTEVEHEYKNASIINKLKFPKPKVMEMFEINGQYGIVYEKIKGISLLDWLMATGDISECARYMADLHQEILNNQMDPSHLLPSYKDFLSFHINKTSGPNKSKALKILDDLPQGNVLCHGDYHPGNIFIHEGTPGVIDFMNICCGSFMYDVARTVYLIEYTPVGQDEVNRQVILAIKKELAGAYLKKMQVTRDRIEDYLYVIDQARRGECPGEFA